MEYFFLNQDNFSYLCSVDICRPSPAIPYLWAVFFWKDVLPEWHIWPLRGTPNQQWCYHYVDWSWFAIYLFYRNIPSIPTRFLIRLKARYQVVVMAECRLRLLGSYIENGIAILSGDQSFLFVFRRHVLFILSPLWILCLPWMGRNCAMLISDARGIIVRNFIRFIDP